MKEKINIKLKLKRFEILPIFNKNNINSLEQIEEIASENFSKKSIKKTNNYYNFLTYKFSLNKDDDIKQKIF